MSNVSFTRDEVILTLDVLYSAGNDKLGPRSLAISELSALLRRLPIHPSDKRPENFRNSVGVSHQIDRFRKGYLDSGKTWNVGGLFFEVDADYKERRDDLHAIAEAIKRNERYFEDTPYGSDAEADGFPEGALLGHLHRLIEQREGEKYPLAERCAICQLNPEEIYKPCKNLLKNHLTVPVTLLDASRKYPSNYYITVCPTCHAALHRVRPWRKKEDCEDILR